MEIIRFAIYNLGFLIFCFLLAVLLFYFGRKRKRVLTKQVFFCFAAVFSALTVYEIIGLFTDEKPLEYSGSYASNPLVSGRKPVLGYGPTADSAFQVSGICKKDDQVIYDVIYSYENGRRITPGNNPSAKNTAHFLGCSYTFGDGVNDNQTTPYFFNAFSKGRFNVQNHGFSGYGTHQAYVIARDYIQKNETPNQAYAFYLFIPSHIERAAGISDWDFYGPHFEVENDSLVFKGSFEDSKTIKRNFLSSRIQTIWKNSYLYKSVFYPKIKEQDIVRTSKLIEAMDHVLKEKNIQLIVLIHCADRKNELKAKLYKDLKAKQIKFIFADQLIPDIESNRGKYRIPYDHHPNAYLNRLLGKKLAEKMVTENQ